MFLTDTLAKISQNILHIPFFQNILSIVILFWATPLAKNASFFWRAPLVSIKKQK